VRALRFIRMMQSACHVTTLVLNHLVGSMSSGRCERVVTFEGRVHLTLTPRQRLFRQSFSRAKATVPFRIRERGSEHATTL
jgi:hypothetical protein